MEQYENLKIEVIEFEADDVITQSDPNNPTSGSSDPVGGG